MHHIEVEQDEPREGKEHQEKAQEPETHLLETLLGLPLYTLGSFHCTRFPCHCSIASQF